MPSASSYHVGLADDGCCNAKGAEVVTECELSDRKRDLVPCGAVAENGATRVIGRAGGTADGRLHVGALKAHALGCQPVDVRCIKVRVAVARQVIPAQLIRHDEQDVFHGGHRAIPSLAVSWNMSMAVALCTTPRRGRSALRD